MLMLLLSLPAARVRLGAANILGLALAAAATPLALMPAHAQGYCSEPVVPLCLRDIAGGSTAVESAAEQEQCRADVERYLASMNEYRDCLNASVDAASEKIADAERRFACLSGEGASCD